jgi:hypothetical protein
MTPALVAMTLSVGDIVFIGGAASSSAFARPKSRTFTLPSAVIYTFAGRTLRPSRRRR